MSGGAYPSRCRTQERRTPGTPVALRSKQQQNPDFIYNCEPRATALRMKHLVVSCFLALTSLCSAQNQPSSPPPSVPDLSHTPTLYVVGYAHLDTEWRGGDPQNIRENISDN